MSLRDDQVVALFLGDREGCIFSLGRGCVCGYRLSFKASDPFLL